MILEDLSPRPAVKECNEREMEAICHWEAWQRKNEEDENREVK